MGKIEVVDQSTLRWPDGWGRTLIEHRKSRSSWKKPFSAYREAVIKELERIGATAVTISRSPVSKETQDPAVAVWFSMKPRSDYSWQNELQLDNPAPSLQEIDNAFRRLVKNHHPDAVANGSGGDVKVFYRLDEARKRARAWVLGQDAPVLDNCIPCDKFVEARQNLAAIRLALGAFRQLERVGIPAILERVMERAFRTALPVKASEESHEPVKA